MTASRPEPAGAGTAAGSPPPPTEALLAVEGLQRRFGGLAAVDVEHLEVARGRITALIGPNGAGKTTLFNLLTGFDRPDAGRILFEGRPVTGVAAHRRARAGMVRTFQLTKALSHLTVLENMKLAATDQSGERFVGAFAPRRWRRQEAEIEGRADELLARFRLDQWRDHFAGTLSGGQRKLLEMARALMVRPRLLLLDEPTAGVNPALTQSILAHIHELRDEGMTVLFVEHDMDVVAEVSDWVVCMAAGRVIAQGGHDSVAADPAVVDAYLGTRRGRPPGEEGGR